MDTICSTIKKTRGQALREYWGVSPSLSVLSAEDRHRQVKPHPEISIRRQCELLGVSRSSLNYERKGESAFNLTFMKIFDGFTMNADGLM